MLDCGGGACCVSGTDHSLALVLSVLPLGCGGDSVYCASGAGRAGACGLTCILLLPTSQFLHYLLLQSLLLLLLCPRSHRHFLISFNNYPFSSLFLLLRGLRHTQQQKNQLTTQKST
ncbi:hypothetical protein Droror1_Dr00006618 [Drosera rotundifolia]